MLVVPQGFTLSVAGVLALTIGHQGFPGLLAIWLFVVGASIGFCAITLASGAHTEVSNRPVSIVGMGLMNLLPILVVPAACSASWWVGDKSAAFFIAGFCGTLFYVAGSGAFLVIVRSGHTRASPAMAPADSESSPDGSTGTGAK
jgi:hypothetical protein